MKKLIFIFFLSILTVDLSAQSDVSGINFQDLTFAQALAKAKETKKPIYIHAYVSWCHICQFMKDSIYPLKDVGDYYNKNFICVKYDMEKEGKDLNAVIPINKFPTMLYINSDGNLMHRAAGRKSGPEFIQQGKDAFDPAKQFVTWQQRYEDGLLTPTEIPWYFRMLNAAGIDNDKLVNEYLQKVPDSLFAKADNWRIINEFYRDVEQPITSRIFKFRKELSANFTADSVDNRLLINFNGTLMSYVQKVDSVGYMNLINKVSASNIDIGPKIISYAELNRARVRSDWTTYVNLSDNYIEKFGHGDHRRLSEIALNVRDHSNDPAILAKAEAWSLEAVKLFDGYRNNHTLAALYCHNGKKKLAFTAANHAIDIAKKNNTDYHLTTQLLDKINQMP